MEIEKKKIQRKKILFVCTGNTCRSPMAEAALRKELRKRKLTGYQVMSAGLCVEPESQLSPNSAQALLEAKMAANKTFKPRQLTEKMLKEAEVVVCMTTRQEQKLAKYGNVTSFPALSGREIPDPYGKDIGVYRETLRKIRECLPLIVEKYCRPHGAEEMDTGETEK